MNRQADQLFEVGRQSLLAVAQEVAACGAPLDPRLELRQGNGLLCYYNLQNGHIYFSAPDPETAQGKFVLLLLRAMLRFDSTEEVLHFLELITPWLVAHEVGHHLRHQYGRFGAQRHEEEWIASQLAIAFVKRSLTLPQQNELLRALAKAMANLSLGLPFAQVPIPIDQVYSPIHHVYTHMNRFYEDLMTAKEHEIAAVVQDYILKVSASSPTCGLGLEAMIALSHDR